MDTGPALTHTPCSRQRIRSAPPLPSYPSSRRRLRILPKLSPRFYDRLSLRRRPNTNTTLPVAGAFTLYRRCRRRRPLRLPLRILFFMVPRSLSLCVAVVLILRYLWWAPRHGSSSPPQTLAARSSEFAPIHRRRRRNRSSPLPQVPRIVPR